MAVNRLAVHANVFIDDTTDVAARTTGVAVPYVAITGDAGEVTLNLGLTAVEAVGNIDRLAAALAEIRDAAIADIGHDPATAALAKGDIFAGMPS